MEFEDMVNRTVTALEKSRLKYVIVGAFAAIYRGKPRTTLDFDLIMEDSPNKIQIFLEELKKLDFDVWEEQAKLFIKEKSRLSIFDNKSILRLDLKIANKLDEFEVLAQAKSEIYKGKNLQVATTEQILYGKILYLGDISDIPNSELLKINDVLDFVNVYRQNKNINLDWLKSKAKEKDLNLTLNKLLDLSEIL